MSFFTSLPTPTAKTAIDVAYRVFTNDRGYPPEARRAAAERVCLPLLRACGDASLRAFFLDHITEIMGTVEADVAKVGLGWCHLDLSRVEANSSQNCAPELGVVSLLY